ncbi:hypothetical protein Smic_40930 [Streptomyces microflavus]|uniref:Uncharacterized protein n=1 Tax=Streptomyces microflavus TaxID=1919 RepID=A0A7J0CUT1_STRMI|nr:hypothetical protein Smic_40930 [Streptomyces microflavus]
MAPSEEIQTETPDPTTPPARTRGADTRALTQVLFGQLKDLEPGTPEHGRVRAALIEANLPSSGTPPPASAAATSRWRTSSRSAPSA